MYKIEVIESSILSRVPQHLKTGERVYFDLFANSHIDVEQNVANVTRSKGKPAIFTRKFTVPPSLPMTLKNEIIFSNGRRVKTIVTFGKVSLQRTIVLNREDFAGHKFQIDFEDDNPVKLAKKVKLHELDLGTFTATEANILQNWQEQGTGENTAYFPLVDYGNWLDDSSQGGGTATTLIEDFRPWLSPFHLLQKGFESIGWCFESPLFQNSEFGRSQWRYLLGATWHDYDGKGVGVGAEWSRSGITETVVAGAFLPISFPQANSPITYDPESMLSFDTLSNGTITIEVIKHTNTLSYTTDFEFIVLVEARKTTVIDNTLSVAFFQEPDSIKTIDLTDDWAYYEFILPVQSAQGMDLWLVASSSVEFAEIRDVSVSVRGVSTHIYRGDNIPLAQLIKKDLTLYDLLLAEMDLFNGHLDVDESRRLITFYPPFKVNVFGDSVEGFYRNAVNALPLPFDYKILSIQYPETIDKENTLYAFNESSDSFLQLQVEEGNIETADLYTFESESNGVGYDTDERRHTLYEPTLNHPSGDTLTSLALLFEIPYLRDNTDGELSYEIGLRCCIGSYTQGAFNGTPYTFKFEGVERDKLPHAWQELSSAITLNGNIPVKFNFEMLHALFFIDTEKGFSQNETIALSVVASESDVHDFELRAFYKLQVKGRQVVLRAITADYKGAGKGELILREDIC